MGMNKPPKNVNQVSAADLLSSATANGENVEALAKRHLLHGRWRKVVMVFAAIVVFCTVYALILPVIAMDDGLICDLDEHSHTDKCYTEVVVEPEARDLVCDAVEHQHSDACYETQKVLVCGMEEGELNADGTEHAHTDACYETQKILVCDLAEHQHSDACYEVTPAVVEKQLTCGKEEHQHADACYDAPKKAAADKVKESEQTADDGYFCGIAEHKHSDECYGADGKLICTLKEHKHTEACKSDKTADVETAKAWESTFASVIFTGKWDEDVLALAKSQMGYQESTANFVIDEKDLKKGYSRYGAWYGDPYGDWCAMFVSFCLDYAGVDPALMPQDSNCASWINKLAAEELDLFHAAAAFKDPYKNSFKVDKKYEPKPGDLIFFDWDAVSDKDVPVREADHIGFVKEVQKNKDGELTKIVTIEGNAGTAGVDCVCENTYAADDATILGYGELPQNPAYTPKPIDQILTSRCADGAKVSLDGKLLEGAVASIKSSDLTQAELLEILGPNMFIRVTDYAVYDIKAKVDGETCEPSGKVEVTVDNPDVDMESDAKLGVIHIDGETGDAEKLTIEQHDDSVTFETESFSDFVIYAYTVDFHEGDIEYSLPGGDSILLSGLLGELGLDFNIADITEVVFTDPELLSVEKSDGDWLLTSLKAFDTTEALLLVFKDGTVYTIAVTDYNTTAYWKEVTSIDDPDAVYMITDSTATKCIGVNPANTPAIIRGTNINFSAVEGHDGYYVSVLGRKHRWSISDGFGSSGTAAVQSMQIQEGVSTPIRYLNPNVNSYLSNNPVNLTFSRSGGYWRISNGNYYLSYSGGQFNRVTSASADCNLRIFKQVSRTELFGTGGGGGGGVVTPQAPTHTKYIDAFRDGDSNPDTTLDDQEGLDLTDLYRLYLTVGPDVTSNNVDVLFILDRSTSMDQDFAYTRDDGEYDETKAEGRDATDIQGAFPTWRKYALTSMLNGMTPEQRGGNNENGLVENGLLYKIKSLGDGNKVGIGNFNEGYFDAEDISGRTYGWRTSGSSTDDIVAVADARTTGTNYCAALRKAHLMFEDAAVKNDGNKKIVVFLTDGVPNKTENYYPPLPSGYSNNLEGLTNYAIDTFKAYAEENDIEIYAIAVGDAYYADYLNRLAGDKVIIGTDFQVIMRDLEIAITNGMGFYTNMCVEDELSDDVSFNIDGLGNVSADDERLADFKIERVPVNAHGGATTKILYEYSNGSYGITADGQDYLDSVSVNFQTGKITVAFKDDLGTDEAFQYRIAYNVRTTQEAYDRYAENLSDGNEGYYDTDLGDAEDGVVRGDEGTDYTGNTTSSGKPGWHSNEFANLHFSQGLPGEEQVDQDSPYDHPVIQVSTQDLTVSKEWADGGELHSDQSIGVDLYAKPKTSTESGLGEKVGSCTLSAANNWTYKFTDLPKGYNYTVQEAEIPAGYVPEYSQDSKGNWKVLNKPDTATVTLQKVAQDNTLLPLEGVEFNLYTTETATEPIGTYVTGSDGTISMEGLDIGETYYLEETVPPAGYEPMVGRHPFTVTTGGVTVTFGDDYLTVNDEEAREIYVMNYTGYELPESGATGTSYLYALGAMLIAGAVIAGCKQRRRRERGDA